MAIRHHAHPAVQPERRPASWLLPIGVMVCVTMVRVIYVSLHGAAIPFWDQWDELNHLIGPWSQDAWHAGQLSALTMSTA